MVNSDGSRVEESVKKERAKAMEETKTEGSKEKTPEKKKEIWKVSDEVIYFAEKKFKPSDKETAKLQKIADYMSQNPKVKIQIEGHANESESSVSFLGKRRAFMIQKELMTLGVAEERISYVSKKTEEPAESGNSPKNQRVTFSLK